MIEIEMIEMVEIPDVSFAIGKYPITQAQYQKIIGTNPSYFINNPQNPVEQVSCVDAVVFCQKLSEITGKAYRLPTIDEWEYACRAGTEALFSFGDYVNQLKDYIWYWGNFQCKTHPVGQKKPNAWGLYDMSGNVWEWTEEGGLRGGSCRNLLNLCRSAFRYYYIFHRDNRNLNLGFRVVCDCD